MPLRHVGNVQLLVEHHVDRVPNEAPAVGIDDQGDDAGTEERQANGFGTAGEKASCSMYAFLESEQTAEDIQDQVDASPMSQLPCRLTQRQKSGGRSHRTRVLPRSAASRMASSDDIARYAMAMVRGPALTEMRRNAQCGSPQCGACVIDAPVASPVHEDKIGAEIRATRGGRFHGARGLDS